MLVIKANDPDHGLYSCLSALQKNGVETGSRNGPVLRFPTPVTSVYHKPRHRVSLSPLRDANPFLHLMEAMWMLNGGNDLATVAYYAKQMESYSDDGVTLNAAYGYRWRKHFGHDQIKECVEILKKDISSRQAIIQIWDEKDLVSSTKDRACNLAVIFDAQLGALNMTVTNRSNDIVWGCYGANAVHFSFLHEYVAEQIGIPLGTYYQVSNNLHFYTEFDISKRFYNKESKFDWYSLAHMNVNPYDRMYAFDLDSHESDFDAELSTLISNYKSENYLQFANQFLSFVAEPMRYAYVVYKSGDKEEALSILKSAQDNLVGNNDWLTAGILWLERRIKKEQK